MKKKNKTKVLVLIPTKGTVDPKVLESLTAQDFQDFSILINPKQPDVSKSRLQNIIDNRIETREKALKSDAEYYLWLDSDVILPKNALSAFLKCSKPLMGASYLIAPNVYSTGKMENGFIKNFTKPVGKEIDVDHLAFGAMMMNRDVLEKVKISPIEIKTTMPNGQLGDKCECAVFCEDAKKAGFKATALPITCLHNRKPNSVKMPVDIVLQVIKYLGTSSAPMNEVNPIIEALKRLPFIVE